MTDKLDKNTENAVLKAVTDLVEKLDQAKQNEAAEEQTKALKAVQSCMQDIKVKLNVVQSEQKAFYEARRDRSENCDKIHNDFEQRLRKIPLPNRCKTNERCIEKIEIEIGKITPFMYKVAGATILAAVVITPIIGVIITYIIKKLGG